MRIGAVIHTIRYARIRRFLGVCIGLCYLAGLGKIYGNSVKIPSFEHVVVDTNGPMDMHSKTVGDFNNDSFMDLVVAGTTGTIYWYEYPSWIKHVVTTSGGGWSTDLNTADIDGDGNLDLVASDYYNNDRIGWFENPGTNSEWTFHIIGSPAAHNIEVADLDGDSDLDIVTRNQDAQGDRIEIWRQNNPDSWTHRTLSAVIGEGIDVGDLDRDGYPDIIIAEHWYKNPVDIVNGNWSTYSFAANWNWPATYVVVADIDADGLTDVVLTPTESQGGTYRTSWYEAPVDPTASGWEEHIIENPIETVTHSLQVADMNNDGHLDVITAEMHQGEDPDEVRVYLNSDGVGGSWLKEVVDTRGSHNLQVVDIGNDGDIDLFGTNWSGTSQVDLWVNDLDSAMSLDSFTYIQIDDSRASQYFGLGIGDLTGDGYGDIVSGRYFYRNPGGNLSGSWARIDFPAAVDALLVMGVDKDTHGDVIAMDSSGKIYWLEAADAIGNAWSAMIVGDLGSADHDISTQGYATGQIVPGGKSEIIITVPSGIYYFEIPENPEEGGWPLTLITDVNYPEGVAVGDIDNDGNIDVASTVDSTLVAWWKNPGIGGTSWIRYDVGSTPSLIADRFGVADLNGDGRLDIAVSVANGSTNGVFWFEAPFDPKSPSWIRHTVVVQDTTNSMDLADMDSDGDIDIISGEHRGSKNVAIWENDGLGNFTEHIVDSGRESHLGVRVFDLDDDGDFDIVSIAWDDFPLLHLWRNDALTGQPPEPTPPLPPQNLRVVPDTK